MTLQSDLAEEDRPGEDEIDCPPQLGREILVLLVEELVLKGYTAGTMYAHSSYGWTIDVKFKGKGRSVWLLIAYYRKSWLIHAECSGIFRTRKSEAALRRLAADIEDITDLSPVLHAVDFGNLEEMDKAGYDLW